MQRDGEFDHAETGAEMPARHRNRVDRLGAQLVGELAQFILLEASQVLGIMNAVEQGSLRGLGHDALSALRGSAAPRRRLHPQTARLTPDARSGANQLAP